MRIQQNTPFKTLGPVAARFVTTAYEQGRQVFTLADVARITDLRMASARSFARKLVDRGVATRLKAGLFTLVPFELGRERVYMGNPYVVAREMMRGKPYYISHASAMDLHGMLTQPRLGVVVTSPAAMRRCHVLGTAFRFVHCKPSHVFGTTQHWVDKQERVVVSDPERTVVDGLKQSEYCGGFTEVAKGFWIRREEMDVGTLVDYALRLEVGAVLRRLGYLLEAYQIDAPDQIARLRARLTSTYLPLDPVLPAEGRFLARWRLRINVSPEEIQAVVRI